MRFPPDDVSLTLLLLTGFPAAPLGDTAVVDELVCGVVNEVCFFMDDRFVGVDVEEL